MIELIPIASIIAILLFLFNQIIEAIKNRQIARNRKLLIKEILGYELLYNYKNVDKIESFVSSIDEKHNEKNFSLSGKRSGSGLTFVEINSNDYMQSLSIERLSSKELESLRPLLVEESDILFSNAVKLHKKLLSFNEMLDSITAVVIGDNSKLESLFFGNHISITLDRCAEMKTRLNEIALNLD